jgi:hypothetical protein
LDLFDSATALRKRSGVAGIRCANDRLVEILFSERLKNEFRSYAAMCALDMAEMATWRFLSRISLAGRGRISGCALKEQ